MKNYLSENQQTIKSYIQSSLSRNYEKVFDLNSFINALKLKHPILTKTDIEIACFIRLGKTRREIAVLRGITVSSMKTSRSRLRKKMELSKDVLLDDYLASLQ